MKSWKERIDEAIELGEFSWTDHLRVEQWNTCAIGERFQLHRDRLEGPLFDESDWRRVEVIKDLGCKFQKAVQNNLPLKAKYLYNRIQRFKPSSNMERTTK
jgi:hypothetical protein